ncbi:MAG: type II toxin-antitoxin system PemK/MazF family toxin [Lachnospiraceae bacterium]|nr:type II toxin-antitoxin system PemK/MazF family toxin [Lachnospiraceae bacterium]
MAEFTQGDIVKVKGFREPFLIVSNNAFIKSTNVFHVSPILKNIAEGPLHINIKGEKNTGGTVICEQVKLIDPAARGCHVTDRISYGQLMNVSDAVQGMFEYD